MNIEALRARATVAIVATAVLLGLISVIAEWLVQGGPGLASAAAIAFALVLGGTFAVKREGQAIRYLAVSAMMAEVMTVVLALRGNPMQIDTHMIFFAALALCAMMLDARAIALGALLVAVHHLGLGLLMESFVFYGGDALTRIVFHAVVLVGEAAALIWLAATTAKLMSSLATESESVRQLAHKTTEMSEAAEAERRLNGSTHAAMMARLQQQFGKVVDAAVAGDFSHRVTAEFTDAELNGLASGVNTLVETVDRGLTETGQVLAALANTDLTQRMTGSYSGAFAKLKDDTNAVGDKLTEIVGKLRGTSRGVRTATTEILEGANDLSERTTRQAATIEETSAAMEQLAATVGQNADRADAACQNAETVRKSAEEGGVVMAKANAAMESITQSSAKISNIIGMIDDIAFQTNLLALNASVEAARAGDAGKGFAVVAVEVRRLAQSSANASSEIKVLIQQSAAEVGNGSKLVADAADKLATMLDGVRGNNTALVEMAGASRSQASSISEVSAAVRQMDEMTQHNAALVEEINASIEQTESQASELDRIVDVFTIDEHRASHSAAAKPAASINKPTALASKPVSRRAAAASYRTQGNAAISKDWAEF